MILILVLIGWLYVALMMAVAEAASPIGSVTGAIFTFVLYGAAPVSLVMYLMATPARKRAIKAREAAREAAQAAELAGREEAPGEQRSSQASREPDGSGETSADTIAPVRKEL